MERVEPPQQQIAQQSQRQGGQPLRRCPGAGATVAMRAQPVGIVQGIPGPAGQGQQTEHYSTEITERGDGLETLGRVAHLRQVDATNAQHDEQQRRGQIAPGVASIPVLIADIGADGDHHRQGADKHGGHGGAHPLDGASQTEVIEQIANGGQLQRLEPVLTAQLAQVGSIQPGNGQGDQTKGQIASHGLQWRRIVR